MKNDNVLGGFEAVFAEMRPGYKSDNRSDSFVDENGVEHIKSSDDEEPDKELVDDQKNDKPTKKEEEIIIPDKVTSIDEDGEATFVTEMFDAFAEKYEWDMDDDEEKPKTVEDFMDYIQSVVEDNSIPQYASEEVQKIDEFIRNGGKLSDYLQSTSDVDLDNIDLSDEESQKSVVRALLKRQGLNDTQITRKISKYEDAGILDDEADEALEFLKKNIEKDKEQLLVEQKKFKEQQEVEQKKFYENVVDTVKALKDIRGISIPEKDKKELLEYIFKPTKSGRTKYQEDYMSNISNLIESAYFTKNGDKLIGSAKKQGEKTAVERFKQKLKSSSTVTSKQSISGSSGKALWEIL